MTFKIQKGYAVPQVLLKRHLLYKRFTGRRPTYPFGQMEVGDSFEVPARKNLLVMRAAANLYSGRHGKDFVVGLDDNKKMRCWRIA